MADTVTMFDPQGVARDIPYDQMRLAIQNGAKPAVRVQAPDNSIRLIPADRIQEAAQHGGKILPLEQQETQRPDFWHSAFSTFASDLPSVAKGVAIGLGGPVSAPVMAVRKGIEELNSVRQTGQTTEALQNSQEKAAGRSLPYRATANVASAIGVPVQPMEQAAEQGDAGAVLGHAAAAASPIAASLALQGAGKVLSPVADAMSKRMYQSALKPSVASYSTAEVGNMVRTGLEKGIPVSEAGADKLNGLIQDLGNKVKAQIQAGSNAGVTIDPQAVATRADQIRARFANQVNPNADMQAIQASKQEFLANNQQPLSASDAQAMKQGTYQQLRSKYGELGSATTEAQKALARGIKEELEKQFPEIKNLNAQESKLYGLDEALNRAVRKLDNRQLVPVGPVVTGAATGAMSGSGPVGIVGGVLKAVVDDPTMKSKLAIAMSRSGKGMTVGQAITRVSAYSNALAPHVDESKPADQTSQQ